MSYHGDIRLGETHDFKFTTRQISGAPHALAGSPVISAYVGNGTTQITAGITLTVDFDGVVGLNNIRVVATSGNGYATATDVSLVITTGTVNSVSVVGEVVGAFSIENRLLAPNAINRATFAADTGLQSIRSGTAQAGAASTITLDAGASAADDFYNGTSILTTGGTGAGQPRIITDYVGSTKVATVDTAWVTNPNATTTFAIFPSAESAADVAAAVWVNGTRTLTAATNITSTGGTTVPQTGDSFARIGATGSGLTSLASQASVNTVDDFLDTEVAAIKAKTDSLTFTVGGQVDANIQSVNDVALQGVGTAGSKWRPV